MRPKWPKLASLAQEICTLWFQFFDAVFPSKRYPFKNIFQTYTWQNRSKLFGIIPNRSTLEHYLWRNNISVSVIWTNQTYIYISELSCTQSATELLQA